MRFFAIMKSRIFTALIGALAAACGGCVSVDDSVAQKPSAYWKAQKSDVPQSEISPEQIQTDKILTEEEMSERMKRKRDEALKAARAAEPAARDSSSSGAQSEKMALSGAEKLELGRPLEIEDLVDIALENNTQTRVYWFQAKVYAANKGKAYSSYYPQVSVGAQFYRSRIKPSMEYLPNIGHYYETGYGPSAEITWLLYDFGKRESQVESAREALRAANFDYNQIIQDVVLNVNVAYYNLYAAMGSVRAARMTIEDAKTSYESANARLQEGVGRKQDMLNALANYRNAEYFYEKAVSEVETARANLASALGIRVSQNLKISDEISLPDSKEASEKIDALIAKALRSRQSLLAAYAQLSKAAADTETARRNFLPQIGAYGQAAYTDFSSSDRGAQEQYTVGLQLSWSIFEGFARKYDLIAAKMNERIQAQNLKAAEIEIISNIWTYYHAYQSALKQVASMKAAVEANEQAYEATRMGYESSVNSITDLLNAQNSLSTAREEQVQANATLAVSIARLAHATGALTSTVPPESDLESIPEASRSAASSNASK